MARMDVAERYRERAHEVRLNAWALEDRRIRELFLLIAEDYECLAKLRERLSAHRQN